MRYLIRRRLVFVPSGQLKQNGRHFITTSAIGANTLQIAPRQLRSNFWIPQATLAQKNESAPDAGQLLVRAGYLRQAYSGIFHMLPLGLKVQSKIEALIDKHMQSLSASKVSLSSISSQKLWDRTGRLNTGSEFFRFKDRKDADWLLAPTHEEEITSLVKDIVHAPGHLPIRLYQIGRKYRDEKRPRGGLLRGREFTMKDLYTFDKTEADAHATYADVRQAYRNLFDEFKLPYVEARADSGNMGGNLSHEFHFPSNLGEDDIITCATCNYAKNEEFVPDLATTFSKVVLPPQNSAVQNNAIAGLEQSFVSRDRKTLVRTFAVVPDKDHARRSINPFVVKACLSSKTEIDTGVEQPEVLFSKYIHAPGSAAMSQVYYLFDQLADDAQIQSRVLQDREWLSENKVEAFVGRITDSSSQQSHLLEKMTGDVCPDCASTSRQGTLNVTKAIEVGHTFHLGSRYSSKLDLVVPRSGQQDPRSESAFVSMGCHGIGVSRLIAAVASALSDSKGLLWPRSIAPFEVLVIVNAKHKDSGETTEVGNTIYDHLSHHKQFPADVLIDDREDVEIGWKLKDADLIGYPVIVVIGKGWSKNKLVEIQCRRLGLKEEVTLQQAPDTIRSILGQL
ncbi:hypothetical protein H2198_007299 [Neophaeococcomyces mojaviensis]|uniref:Uncharacterized protein n=1 Tax=Neophaeococcomyces mojaviensis TaxID=3383035 RepID=A0ACC3A0V6_9EURO|nr:hypothetical protein H2198_007299 [Knufia sp. JES_112]